MKTTLDQPGNSLLPRSQERLSPGTERMRMKVHHAIHRLVEWLERNDYRGYDTFDGLSARFLRPLTFNRPFLRNGLQQGVRRFPINLRPMLGIAPSRSTKGMGFLARGFLRLYHATGDTAWWNKAKSALEWLQEHKSPYYSNACWGNHFDYQARGNFFLPRGMPTVVWTSLIGHAFLDAYASSGHKEFLAVAASACEHLLHDVKTTPDGASACVSYTPIHNSQVHNANTLAASLLARTYSYTGNQDYRLLAEKAVTYTACHQRPDSSWYYGEASYYHWIDNFHTAYVLDSFKHYIDSTGDDRFEQNMMNGYIYWKDAFFLPDGCPKYYNDKTRPIDIQCCSQAIDTLVFFHDRDPESISLAHKVAYWTIEHMQDMSGYFYYRRYSLNVVNKTPTLHWGQATMLCALAGLYRLT